MALADLSSADIVVEFAKQDPDDFLVMRYQGTEGLCQLYRFEIELATKVVALKVDDIVGNSAVLNISTPGGRRWFHGIISRFESIGHALDTTYYRAELVPFIWLLTHRYSSRIFQNRTVREIITQVLTDADIPADMFKFSAKDGPPREYCVKYRETDYNFIARLMEDEGMRWFFEQTEERHILHIQDSSAAYRPITNPTSVNYVPPGGMHSEEESIQRFRMTTAVRPGAVRLNDFDFQHPALDLHSDAGSDRNKGLAFHDYPGKYVTQQEGKRYAALRAEAFETSRRTAVGMTDSYRLQTGHKFTLAAHPMPQFNAEYLVTTLSHRGRQSGGQSSISADGSADVLGARLQSVLNAASNHNDDTIRGLAESIGRIAARLRSGDPTAKREIADWLHHAGQVVRDLPSVAEASGENPLRFLTIPNQIADIARPEDSDHGTSVYECRFECIPATVLYRPPRITPWPVMRGAQTARVVGPDSEEIHCDKFGRVKVQFNWDLEGNEAGQPKRFGAESSCWIRVSQGMAGGRYGMVFLPRIGQEVIVDFLEGDPDQPVITGGVYNADQMPPYELPKEKTKSVIKTHSSKGGGGTNEIRFEDLAGEEQLLINAQYDHHVRVGNEERRNILENRFLTIENGEDRKKVGLHRSCSVGGKDALSVKETRSVKVEGDVYENFGANHDQSVGGEYHVKANKIVFEADVGISFKVGGNFVVIASSGVMINGKPLIMLNSGGAALPSSIGVRLASPAEPEAADEVEPGKDVSYSGKSIPMPPLKPERLGGQWISIELRDFLGIPQAGEIYEITTPSGKKKRGSLDVNGYAKVFVQEEGQCQIGFPYREADDWNRA